MTESTLDHPSAGSDSDSAPFDGRPTTAPLPIVSSSGRQPAEEVAGAEETGGEQTEEENHGRATVRVSIPAIGEGVRDSLGR